MSTLITCHANADFDALAALVGASLLYDNAQLLFPGTSEMHVQRYIDEVGSLYFSLLSSKEVDFASITRLVIVDTCQKTRLSHVTQLLDKEDIEVIVWDHHPSTPDDINYNFMYYEELGATSTLIANEIKDRNIYLNEQEAALLTLGIHVDTGSFTYISTTEKDLYAVAYILQFLPNGFGYSEYLRTELTSFHIKALNELLESAQTHEVMNTTLVIAHTSSNNYLHDFAMIAPRFMDMLPCKAFFALAMMGEKIQILARSMVNTVDVGAICRKLGGGGHSYAASATVKNMTMGELKDTIVKEVFVLSNAKLLAKNLMSAPVVFIDEDTTMHEAAVVMNRYGLKAVPVVQKNTKTCIGWISQEQASRASSHDMTYEARVSLYMQRFFQVVTRTTPLQTLMDTVIGGRQRLLPVVDSDDPTLSQNELKKLPLVGVVTRTDMIRLFADENVISPLPTLSKKHKEKNMLKALSDYVGSEYMAILKKAGELANELGYDISLVGGFVRDVILRSKPKQATLLDLDLVVEGDGIKFAHELAKILKGRVIEHRTFLTATIFFRNSKNEVQRLDVATSRVEYYEYPAALPTVEFSSLKMDLYRRDFTINAMAIRLNPSKLGLLVDFFQGQNDIRNKKIRILHTLSFIEDPTRMIRAIRFEQRYGFNITQQSEKLIQNAIDLQLIDKLSGRRIITELDVIIGEDSIFKYFKRLESFNILHSIHPLLKLENNKEKLISEIADTFEWYRRLYFEKQADGLLLVIFGLIRMAQFKELMEIIERLQITGKRKSFFIMLRAEIMALHPELKEWFNTSRKVSELYELLQNASVESVLYLMARANEEELKKYLSQYIYKWRYETSDVTGKDLRNLGIPSGEIYKELLKLSLHAKLDNPEITRDEQLEIIQNVYKK